MTHQFLYDKISNHAQVGGIETSTLDDGAARGTRIAWINTGTGLRFKVVIDRAMDIADAFYNEHSLAWISHAGVTAPQPFSNGGIDWLKTFGGGLLTTCGLSHVGGPETDGFGQRGLHGEISNLPATIESIIQPDPANGKMEMSITGIIKQSQALGIQLVLRRIISARIGEPFIQIHDEVANRGNTIAPHMLLYHCNFGWPFVDEGTKIVWNGKWQSREGIPYNKIFKEGNDFKTCAGILEEHSGGGEEAAFIDINPDKNGTCQCGLYNPALSFAVVVSFDKKNLPWLINWQHWGKGEYVTGLEPATNPPIGQGKARAQKTLIELAPGESRIYNLKFEILLEKKAIDLFVDNNTIADQHNFSI